MELKQIIPDLQTAQSLAINRTIMELKPLAFSKSIPFRYSINRTIMELKPDADRAGFDLGLDYQSHHYGIETISLNRPRREKDSINRTIMELKLTWQDPIWSRVVAINRTIMELKQNFCKSLLSSDISINRTIMELKQGIVAQLALQAQVYQSHHYGIET